MNRTFHAQDPCIPITLGWEVPDPVSRRTVKFVCYLIILFLLNTPSFSSISAIFEFMPNFWAFGPMCNGGEKRVNFYSYKATKFPATH